MKSNTLFCIGVTRQFLPVSDWKANPWIKKVTSLHNMFFDKLCEICRATYVLFNFQKNF